MPTGHCVVPYRPYVSATVKYHAGRPLCCTLPTGHSAVPSRPHVSATVLQRHQGLFHSTSLSRHAAFCSSRLHKSVQLQYFMAEITTDKRLSSVYDCRSLCSCTGRRRQCHLAAGGLPRFLHYRKKAQVSLPFERM